MSLQVGGEPTIIRKQAGSVTPIQNFQVSDVSTQIGNVDQVQSKKKIFFAFDATANIRLTSFSTVNRRRSSRFLAFPG
jgi:hypothetical protein